MVYLTGLSASSLVVAFLFASIRVVSADRTGALRKRDDVPPCGGAFGGTVCTDDGGTFHVDCRSGICAFDLGANPPAYVCEGDSVVSIFHPPLRSLLLVTALENC